MPRPSPQSASAPARFVSALQCLGRVRYGTPRIRPGSLTAGRGHARCFQTRADYGTDRRPLASGMHVSVNASRLNSAAIPPTHDASSQLNCSCMPPCPRPPSTALYRPVPPHYWHSRITSQCIPLALLRPAVVIMPCKQQETWACFCRDTAPLLVGHLIIATTYRPAPA
jgi:hypothetical protein